MLLHFKWQILIFLSILICTSEYVSVHMSEDPHGAQKRVLDALDQSDRWNKGSGNQTYIPCKSNMGS